MIIDTGVLYALLDRSDRNHAGAKRVFARREARIVPEPVIVETAWLASERLGADVEAAFIAGLGDGSLVVETTLAEDRKRASALILKYRDANIGYVDAVVVAVAERLEQTVIATLDRRHFRLIRPLHLDAFQLVP